jgi:hypothetical protein
LQPFLALAAPHIYILHPFPLFRPNSAAAIQTNNIAIPHQHFLERVAFDRQRLVSLLILPLVQTKFSQHFYLQ